MHCDSQALSTYANSPVDIVFLNAYPNCFPDLSVAVQIFYHLNCHKAWSLLIEGKKKLVEIKLLIYRCAPSFKETYPLRKTRV